MNIFLAILNALKSDPELLGEAFQLIQTIIAFIGKVQTKNPTAMQEVAAAILPTPHS
jgi:hypothetical protein